MSIKTNFKLKIVSACIAIIGLFGLSIIIIPPMIDLNSMKPRIENIILAKTGVPAKIHGDINFSLLGQATIVAHNISIPNGVVSSCEFQIPIKDIFDIDSAEIYGDIIVNGASLVAEKITPFNMDATIKINDSKVRFLNKEYNIISGKLSKNKTNLIIRTDQHKYEIQSLKNKFTVKNKNNNLDLSGVLFEDGTAVATISIIAQNINRWFEFEKPRITGTFPITADIKWNGSYGITFSNISAHGVSGDAVLQEDGYKILKLKTINSDYNMDFILTDTELLQNGSFTMDFYGKTTFLNQTFKHLYIDIIGSDKKIQIKKIIADNLNLSGGYIDANGAHNILVKIPENGIEAQCLFSGTPEKWSCEKMNYGNKLSGDIKVDNDDFVVNVSSYENIDDINKLIKSARKFGNKGIINFNFADMIGQITIKDKNVSIKYDYAANKDLAWTKLNLPFLPDFMKQEKGNFIWQNDSIVFVPDSKTWYFTMDKDHFQVSGDNFKKWAPELDLQSMRDLAYIISGNYKKGNISDLTLEIAQHRFVGSASGKSITLKTDILNIDSFASQSFIDNYEDLSFFTVAPITIPFDIDVNVSLSADTLIYKGKRYNNFVYSLKPKVQTFSITDSDRGNLLATIKKENLNYDINIQLNKFVMESLLLPKDMPLNISNFSVTADINLKTSGKIAHDIFDNIEGTFDLSIDGGKLYGLGFDKFYASAQNLTILNAEYALANALENGETAIKNMRVIGTYKSGDIKTTTPLIISLRHVDGMAMLDITRNKMYLKSQFILRGTSAGPSPIELTVFPDGKRKYSLSEIMMNFDPEYMRSFTKSHNQF